MLTKIATAARPEADHRAFREAIKALVGIEPPFGIPTAQSANDAADWVGIVPSRRDWVLPWATNESIIDAAILLADRAAENGNI